MRAKDAIAILARKEKTAGKGKVLKKVVEWGEKHPVAKGFAIYGMGLPAIYAASSSAVKGVSKAYNSAMKGHRMDKMFDVYPDLKDEDQNKVRLAFNTINRLNPNFASDPLIAGTWVKRVLDSDVGGGPMVDPQAAGQLTKSRDTSNIASIAAKAMTKQLDRGLAPGGADPSRVGGEMPSLDDINQDLYAESLRDQGPIASPGSTKESSGLPSEVQEKLDQYDRNNKQWT